LYKISILGKLGRVYDSSLPR